MFEIKERGLGDVARKLGGVSDRVRDARPAFIVMAANLRQKIGREQFETEGRARGTPWPALRPKTVLARRRRWGYYRRAPRGTPRILHWAGGLRRSLENRGSAKHIERIGRDQMEWGSELPRRPTREGRPIIAFRPGEEREFLTVPLIKHILGADGNL